MFFRNLLFILMLAITSAFSIPINEKSTNNTNEYIILTDSSTTLEDLKGILKNYEINSIISITQHMKKRVYKVNFKSKISKEKIEKLDRIIKVEENNVVKKVN